MTDAAYRNFQHYIRDGWAAEPKESFKALAAHLIVECGGAPSGSLLDIGCATGELIGFLSTRFPDLRCTGVDIFDELLEQGRLRLPAVDFVRASALDLPDRWHGRFDVVTAVGVASVFDDEQIGIFWKNLLAAAKPGGLVVVLSPLNEYGVDTIIRHRKRIDGQTLRWETGWNVFAVETVREIVASLGGDLTTKRFRFEQRLEPKPDPVRTWTLPTEREPFQLTNGLKLLVDHYFMFVRTPVAQEKDR